MKAAEEAINDLLTSFLVEHDIDGLARASDWIDSSWIRRDEERRRRDESELRAYSKSFKCPSTSTVHAAQPSDPTPDVRFVATVMRTDRPGPSRVLTMRAEALLQCADRLADEAASTQDRDLAFRRWSVVRQHYKLAADEFVRLHTKLDLRDNQRIALRNAAFLYERAGAWADAFNVLAMEERLHRALLLQRNAPTASRARAGQPAKRGLHWADRALIEVIDRRANLHSKLFELPAAIADFREVARLDPDGKHGIDALHTAARLAYHDGDFATSTALDATIVRRFAKYPKHRDAVDDSAWRIVEAAERSGERQAWIRALGAYIRRREVSANAEPTRQLAREILDRLRRGLPGRPPPPPSPLANVLAHPPLFVVADPPGTAPGLERELR